MAWEIFVLRRSTLAVESVLEAEEKGAVLHGQLRHGFGIVKMDVL